MVSIHSYEQIECLTNVIFDIVDNANFDEKIPIDNLQKAYVILSKLGSTFYTKQNLSIEKKITDLKQKLIFQAAKSTIFERQEINEKASRFSYETYEGFFLRHVLRTHVVIIEKTLPRLPLWSLEKNGEKQGVLMGTVHYHPTFPQEYDKLEYLFDPFSDCDAVAVELDLSDEQTVKEMEECWKKESASEETIAYRKKHNIEEKNRLHAAYSSNLKNWISESLEKEISICAKNNNIPVISLEEVASSVHFGFQRDLYQSSLPLSLTPASYTSIQEEQINLVAAWQHGKFKRALNLISSEMKERSKLDSRNVQIVEKILKIITEDKINPYVIVGLVHLKGKSGIISLLRQKGYKVIKMDYQEPEEVF